MTIDDELLVELMKPEPNGKVGKEAMIVKIIGKSNIDYNLEVSSTCWEHHERMPKSEQARELIHITPDIVVYVKSEENRLAHPYSHSIAIELENDISWDFQSSLKQTKKYYARYNDVRIIIPKSYERFAPFYKNERIRVYLWSAKRKWKCLRCGTITENESRVPPQCSGKKGNGQTCNSNRHKDFDLIGVKDTKIKEFLVAPEK
jgi:hypothetical protein